MLFDKLSKNNPNIPLNNPIILDEVELEKKEREQEKEDKKNPGRHSSVNEESKKKILKTKEKLDNEFKQRNKPKDDNDLKAGEILKNYYKKKL